MSRTSEDLLWTEEEQSFWLAFAQLSGAGLGVKRVKILYEHYHSLKRAWEAGRAELKQVKGLSDDVIDNFVNKRASLEPEALLSKVKEKNLKIYPLYHPFYPAHLRQIYDPPLLLYVKGELNPDDMFQAVAVVGTRNPTSYGQRLAKEFARGLAQNGLTVVSGMAIGIDSLAHWGAIDGGGKTVAVLGCGIDICYPSSNRRLYNLLADGERGAVVSELFPGTTPEKWHFPARNRIISGMCRGTLVIEAGKTSGSLITAQMAFEQSREVFAIPGRIDHPMSYGTNDLIFRNMAQLVTNYDDILKALGLTPARLPDKTKTVVELYGKEKEVFESIGTESVHFDSLCRKCGMPAGELSATLTMLELANVVERLPGDFYTQKS